METSANMLLTNESARGERPEKEKVNILDVELGKLKKDQNNELPDLFSGPIAAKDFWVKVKPKNFEIEMTESVKNIA